MAFNIADMMRFANSPNKGLQMLLGQASKTNPQVARELQAAMNSGKTPQAFMQEQVQKGNITQANYQQVKQMANDMGFSRNIPQSAWKQMDSAFTAANKQQVKPNAPQSTPIGSIYPQNGFKGF